jgi:predicted AAA+ superfamily ATPase
MSPSDFQYARIVLRYADIVDLPAHPFWTEQYILERLKEAGAPVKRFLFLSLKDGYLYRWDDFASGTVTIEWRRERLSEAA